jgi:hypothetical protein
MEIPTQLTKQHIQQYVNSYLSEAKHGFVGNQSLYKVFNHVLYKLYTGCQWTLCRLKRQHIIDRLHCTKCRTTISVNEVMMEVFNASLMQKFSL